MGTSKRRINAKIKKMLTDKSLTEINEDAPSISEIILTKENLNQGFDEESTVTNTIHIINQKFTSLSIAGYKGKTKKDLSEDELTQQEFFEMILDEIENEKVIESKILKKSLKIVMYKFLDKEFDAYSFTQILFHQVVYELLLTELNDTLKDGFDELSYPKIKEMVNLLTSKIMNQNMHEKINLFVDKKISLEEILDSIITETSNAEFGDF